MTDFQRIMALGVLLYGSLTVAGLFFANLWQGNVSGVGFAVACSFASYITQSLHMVGASPRFINASLAVAVAFGAASGGCFLM